MTAPEPEGLIEHLARLVASTDRCDASAALGRSLGATTALVVALDASEGDPVAISGAPPTSGAGWRDLVDRCRSPGIHRGRVAYPDPITLVDVTACAGGEIAVVLVGGDPGPGRCEALLRTLPLLGAALRVERSARAEAAAAAHALDAATADRDALLLAVGHELRNPLGPIVTALELMRMDGKDSREQRLIEPQVARLARLVDDLLDLSLVTRGALEIHREPVELFEVIARAVEPIAPVLEQKRQPLHIDVPAAGLVIDADPARLARAVGNLVDDAARYSGGGRPIEVVAERRGDRVAIRVLDQGIGFPREAQAGLFAPFDHHRAPGCDAPGRLGVGLAIARSLIEAHGGLLAATSAGEDQGSAFTIDLPAARETAHATTPIADAAQPADPPAKGPTRVLLVDDNEDAAMMLSEILAAAGFSIGTAANGPSALGLAATFAPDIALLDLGLPGMDGLELAAHLRAQAGGRRLHLIALTGYGQPTDHQRTSDAGFTAHLVKPIDVAALRRLLIALSAAV